MCVFCRIINHEIPAYKVYEDDKFLAFLDISQATKGHTLVIPKIHYNSMEDIDPILAGELFSLTVKLANKIAKALGVNNYNILNNKGPLAGQTVEHFHIHIIPRYQKDDIQIKFSTNNTEQEEFLKMQNMITK